MLELAQRLGLDLADALARHRELLADLLQRVFLFMPMPKRMRRTRSSRGWRIENRCTRAMMTSWDSTIFRLLSRNV
jgi:hypothetical protein